MEIAKPDDYVGGLIVGAAVLEITHGFRRAENQVRLWAGVRGAVTLMIGKLLINVTIGKGNALKANLTAVKPLVWIFEKNDRDL